MAFFSYCDYGNIITAQSAEVKPKFFIESFAKQNFQ